MIDLRGRQQAGLARVARTGEDHGACCVQVVTEPERRWSACSSCRRRASSCCSVLVDASIEPTSDVESAGQRVKQARHPCREARQSSVEDAPRSRTRKLAVWRRQRRGDHRTQESTHARGQSPFWPSCELETIKRFVGARRARLPLTRLPPHVAQR